MALWHSCFGSEAQNGDQCPFILSLCGNAMVVLPEGRSMDSLFGNIWLLLVLKFVFADSQTVRSLLC